MKTLKETCYKGTRILLGNEKRALTNSMIDVLIENGYTEIQMPIIQFQETFSGKVGAENNNMMYTFTDLADRQICLAPEYTAVVQKLSTTEFKEQKDVKVFYIAECFRGEKPQAGRYRQFTQLGVEVINPSNSGKELKDLEKMAAKLTEKVTAKYKLTEDVKRGLDYYKDGKGFEISCEELGSSKQVCGGGEYEGGVGFALGIDRLLNLL